MGIRSITSEGRAQAKKFGVRQFEMHSYEDHREYLENLTLGEGCAGVYISIDVDCLDPAYAPGGFDGCEPVLKSVAHCFRSSFCAFVAAFLFCICKVL